MTFKKNGLPWSDKTNYEHGLIAYNWLKQFELREPVKEEILNCIRYHMWIWVKPPEELPRASNATTKELIVQFSDHLASRKGMSFLPGFDVP